MSIERYLWQWSNERDEMDHSKMEGMKMDNSKMSEWI
jgi:hypothetical protein